MTDEHHRSPARPDRADRYTDGSYGETIPSWHNEDAEWKATWVTTLLAEQHVRPSSVCDVGCGSGGVLAVLRKALPNAKLVGFDISPEAVRLAREVNPEVDVRLGDATQCGEQFDLVLLMDVVEHVEDYLGFLRRVGALGGQILLHVPLDMSALGVFRERPIMAARETVGHLHYFSKATVLASLRDAGFSVSATKYTTGAELPNRRFRSRIANVPRRLGSLISPDLTARALGGYSLLVLAERSGA